LHLVEGVIYDLLKIADHYLFQLEYIGEYIPEGILIVVIGGNNVTVERDTNVDLNRFSYLFLYWYVMLGVDEDFLYVFVTEIFHCASH